VRPRKALLNRAAIAVASDGTMFVNVVHVFDDAPATELVGRLVDAGEEVYVGVAVPLRIRTRIVTDVDEELSTLVKTLLPRGRAR
jgi:hypothetical protein